MKELVGRQIKRVLLGPGEESIYFDTNKGVIRYRTHGDCCSETWFSDIFNFAALLGPVVTAVEEKELPDYNTEDGRSRQEVDSVYAYAITTACGTATIAFRNSSNGYYGGNLYDAEFDVVIDPQAYEITDDWKC